MLSKKEAPRLPPGRGQGDRRSEASTSASKKVGDPVETKEGHQRNWKGAATHLRVGVQLGVYAKNQDRTVLAPSVVEIRCIVASVVMLVASVESELGQAQVNVSALY